MMEDVNGLNDASQTLHDASNSPGHALIACPTTGCQTGFYTYSVIINRVNTSAEYLEFLRDGTVESTITEASVGTTAWQEAIDHGFYIRQAAHQTVPHARRRAAPGLADPHRGHRACRRPPMP